MTETAKILLVDDDLGVLKLLMTALGVQYEILVAPTGYELETMIHHFEPDLILLDLAMPEMNGAEAASILKKAMPDVPVIPFTMYSENIGKYLTSAIGVDAVLSKPDGMTALVKAVTAVLAGSS